MAASQFLELKNALSAEKSDIVDILEVLDTLEVNRDILRETKIGIAVHKLRKHTNERVRQLSSQLTQKWKQIVKRAKQETKSFNPTSINVLDELPILRSSTSIVPSATNEPRRKNVRNMLCSSFGESAFAEATANFIEEALNDKYISVKDYKKHAMDLIMNIKRNKEFSNDVLKGKFTPESLVVMSPQDMMSDHERSEREKTRQDMFEMKRVDWADVNRDKLLKQAGIDPAAGGMFRCGRCKSMNTSHDHKQTRGGDEPMTVFVQCHDCKHRWRFG
eukprot:TRINITY_DN777861_c0_g1_i1.p1 TRINITY_DN777861_c0_g1~~TRINITY_DN777861_c0_g1_i1.p1  ORF type:complete len:276 (+),score=36.13 TRINITY_DN777861_c0_g1_i1:51-878(+)